MDTLVTLQHKLAFLENKSSHAMKKLLSTWFALALCGLFQPLIAQGYFQHRYGNFGSNLNDYEVAFDGHRTSNILDGHMISGISNWAPYTGPNKLCLAVTDVDGNLTGSCFSIFYSLFDASTSPLPAGSVYCEELSSSYVLAGADDGMHNVYFAQISNVGNVLASQTYTLGPNYDYYVVNDIEKNVFDNAVYIMGSVVDFTTNRTVLFVIKVRSNGLLLWSQVYDMPLNGNYMSEAWDGVEEPTGLEFTIVGFASVGPFALPQSFLFALDANTGLPSGTPVLLPQDRTDYFAATCIDWSPDPSLPSGGGYIVGGSTGYSTISWLAPTALLVDYDFNSPWFIGNTYSNANDPTPYSYTTADIKTRWNPVTREIDYWMTGPSRAPLPTPPIVSFDAEVWRLDQSINGVSQLLFKNSNNGEVAALDMRNIAGTPALSHYTSGIWGAWGYNTDLMISRSYLNGYLPVGCEWLSYPVATNSNMDMGSMAPPNPVGDVFYVSNGYITRTDVMGDDQICYGTFVSGGDNSKTSNLVATTTEVSLIGNAEDGYFLTFSPATPAASTIHLSLHDITGREIRSLDLALAAGTDDIDLKSWQTGLARGVYVVKWSYAASQGAKKVILGSL